MHLLIYDHPGDTYLAPKGVPLHDRGEGEERLLADHAALILEALDDGLDDTLQTVERRECGMRKV